MDLAPSRYFINGGRFIPCPHNFVGGANVRFRRNHPDAHRPLRLISIELQGAQATEVGRYFLEFKFDRGEGAEMIFPLESL